MGAFMESYKEAFRKELLKQEIMNLLFESTKAGKYEWIVNEPETADDKSPIGNSWKQYWIHDGNTKNGEINNWPKKCSVANCTRDAEHGAHVRDEEGNVFIVPMCARDNNPHNKKDMRLKKSTVMVEVK